MRINAKIVITVVVFLVFIGVMVYSGLNYSKAPKKPFKKPTKRPVKA
jgi:flagellar basal body-associated protein FliL